MKHHGIALVLATTAFHLVREAFQSGNPVLGAGEGNVPVFVDDTADLDLTARSIVESKTFDNGTVCCSEQALAVTRGKDPDLRKAFERWGGRFLNEDEVRVLGRAAFDPDRKIMRSEVVGRPAGMIARKAGIDVPQGTRLLIAPLERIGPEEALSHEILAPILAYYVVKDRAAALKICCEINRFHGKGHTLSMYTGEESQGEEISNMIQSGRILINTPSSLGGLGGTLNRIHPSLTLSCGTTGKNYLTDNITIQHLLNINRIALPRPDAIWEKIPDPAWLDPGFDSRSIDALESGRG
jgi:acetaldehyde dehydrogenase/alcohol dehydrogenase